MSPPTTPLDVMNQSMALSLLEEEGRSVRPRPPRAPDGGGVLSTASDLSSSRCESVLFPLHPRGIPVYHRQPSPDGGPSGPSPPDPDPPHHQAPFMLICIPLWPHRLVSLFIKFMRSYWHKEIINTSDYTSDHGRKKKTVQTKRLRLIHVDHWGNFN